MKNKTLQDAARQILKDLLTKCTEPQKLMFKRMYSHKNFDCDITDAVDQMDSSKIDWAITQVERTLTENKPEGNNE